MAASAEFHDSADRFQLWKRILRRLEVGDMAEIGVWKGDFSAYMLQHCPKIVHYTMIDPWSSLSDWDKPANVDRQQFDAVYQKAMTKTAFAADKRIVLRGRTRDVVDYLPDETLDAVYIDGDHTLRGICIDLIRIAPKIRPGGIIGGDDFTTTPWQHGPGFEPTLVCPLSVYFAEAMDYPIAALPFNQFLIRKTGEEPFAFIDTTGDYAELSLKSLGDDRDRPAGLKRMFWALAKRVRVGR